MLIIFCHAKVTYGQSPCSQPSLRTNFVPPSLSPCTYSEYTDHQFFPSLTTYICTSQPYKQTSRKFVPLSLYPCIRNKPPNTAAIFTPLCLFLHTLIYSHMSFLWRKQMKCKQTYLPFRKIIQVDDLIWIFFWTVWLLNCKVEMDKKVSNKMINFHISAPQWAADPTAQALIFFFIVYSVILQMEIDDWGLSQVYLSQLRSPWDKTLTSLGLTEELQVLVQRLRILPRLWAGFLFQAS